MKDIAEKSLFQIPENLKRFLWVLVIIGVGMFIAGLTIGGEVSVVRTWQAFLTVSYTHLTLPTICSV